MELRGESYEQIVDGLVEEDVRVFGERAWLSDKSEGHGTPKARAKVSLVTRT